MIERQRSHGRSRGTTLPAVSLTEATNVCNAQRQTAAASRVIWSTVLPVVASVVWMYVAAVAASRQRRSFCVTIRQPRWQRHAPPRPTSSRNSRPITTDRSTVRTIVRPCGQRSVLSSMAVVWNAGQPSNSVRYYRHSVDGQCQVSSSFCVYAMAAASLDAVSWSPGIVQTDIVWLLKHAAAQRVVQRTLD